MTEPAANERKDTRIKRGRRAFAAIHCRDRLFRSVVEATGASLLYLPPSSPDLNPIEKCWAKIKLVLRTLKARTAEALDPAITEAITAIASQDAMGWLHHCGYRHSKIDQRPALFLRTRLARMNGG